MEDKKTFIEWLKFSHRNPPLKRVDRSQKIGINECDSYLHIADLLYQNLHNLQVLDKVKDDILICGRGAYFKNDNGTLQYYDIVLDPQKLLKH